VPSLHNATNEFSDDSFFEEAIKTMTHQENDSSKGNFYN